MKPRTLWSWVVGGLLISMSGCGGTNSAVDTSNPSEAFMYSENGNWYVRVVTVDAEGFPDTLEKRAYATEAQAGARIRELRETRGTTARVAESSEATHELRSPRGGEIWTATNEWSLEWEKKFSDWTRANFDPDFFVRYKIKTDCADAPVALRWIYSRIMGLPAGNRLDTGGGLMTNRSLRSIWANLPTAANWYEDQRFLRALEYVMTNTYTHSIAADGYPIAIDETWLTPGSFHLELRKEDGHTRVFTNVTRDANAWPLEDSYSNVPRKVQSLVVEPFTVYNQPPMRSGGILRHRWTRLTDSTAFLVPGDQMPGYSLEQYEPGFFKHDTGDFSVEVAYRLRPGLDPLIGMKSAITNLEAAITERKKVVENGYRICSVESCAAGTANYENWSTPARDERLRLYFVQIAEYLITLRGGDLARAQTLLAQEKQKTLLEFEGRSYRYDDIEAVWKAGRFSSDPTDPPARRWGFPSKLSVATR